MFAFQSLDLLEQWVYDPDWRTALDDEDYVVSVFHVDPDTTRCDSRQCAFDFGDARCLATETVSRFRNLERIPDDRYYQA